MAPMEPSIREWVDSSGRSPFGSWFAGLGGRAAAKITVALKRLEAGNTSKVEALGGGVHELKIDWGPGLRVYFGREGATIIVLLGGGEKHRQQADIEAAKARWADRAARPRTTARKTDD